MLRLKQDICAKMEIVCPRMKSAQRHDRAAQTQIFWTSMAYFFIMINSRGYSLSFFVHQKRGNVEFYRHLYIFCYILSIFYQFPGITCIILSELEVTCMHAFLKCHQTATCCICFGVFNIPLIVFWLNQVSWNRPCTKSQIPKLYCIPMG